MAYTLVLGIMFIVAPDGAAAARPLPHLDLDVALDPTTRELHGVARYPARHDSTISLYETLAIKSISADGKPIAATRIEHHEHARVWRITVPPGTSLRVDYEGRLPPLDTTLNERGVLTLSTPMVSPQGSFLHAGSGWYPEPADFFTYRVTLTVPRNERALVPGHLSNERVPTTADPHYTATFEFAHPAEGVDLMSGPYTIREEHVQRAGQPPIRLRTYFTRDVDDLAQGYLDDSRRYLELYAEQIGAYPFTEFSIVASPLPTGFGMPTLTYLGTAVLKLPFIRATSLGHEILHNWWGNGVYPDYATGNWSEGLTTFMADYYYKERTSADAARDMRLSWLRDFAAIPEGAQESLASFRSRTHGAEAAVGYGKAAMVFFMLRDLIGADAFSRGIRTFWQLHRYSVASWNDLRAAFERASGRSLARFFDQWIQRAGGPSITIDSATVVRDSQSMRLEMSQTAPVYSLHVPIATIANDIATTHFADIDRERETPTLHVKARPERVELDPDLRLWRLLHRDELPPILRQWIIARAPQLAITSSDPAVRSAAMTVAQALFEAAPKVVRLDDARTSNVPLLLVGLPNDTEAVLARLGITRPQTLAMRGTARVWTVQRVGESPIAVIEARDASSLSAMQHALPHYGSQSYFVFEGAKVIDRGVWPARIRAVPVTVKAK